MLSTLTVVLDSNEYIIGLGYSQSAPANLLQVLAITEWKGALTIATPFTVQREVVPNLTVFHPDAPKAFFALIAHAPWQGVSFEEPSEELTLKYLELGLSEEDATIAAYTEAVGAQYLVSENRHFLEELETDTFEVLDAGAFMNVLRGLEAGPASETKGEEGA